MEQPTHSTMFVAPLHITKGTSRTQSRSAHRSQSPVRDRRTVVVQSSGQLTPPLTPHDTQPSMSMSQYLSGHADFHTYLRAFYPYHPTCDESSSTVTLPLNCGDIILVHSVHTNGWADGTLLMSGARGWLPTNYCEPYHLEPIRVLLKALTSFWDMVRGSTDGGLDVFGSQIYVRGLIAGVRCLLVTIPAIHLLHVSQTDCFGRKKQRASVVSHQ